MKRYIPKKRSYEPKRSEPKRSYEPKRKAITPIEYTGLQTAFEHLNRELFASGLPDIFITYQRKANSGGYFGAERFSDRGDKHGQHEIALNPDGFVGKTDEFIVSILLHEMVHLWQHEFGKRPKRSSYHDRQWAAKMMELGLMPTSTGMVGGKITGARMSHYIVDDAAFAKAFTALAATGWKLNLESARRPGAARGPVSKVKSTCPQCGGNGWAKPGFGLTCTACGVEMVPEETAPTVTSYEQAGNGAVLHGGG